MSLTSKAPKLWVGHIYRPSSSGYNSLSAKRLGLWFSPRWKGLRIRHRALVHRGRFTLPPVHAAGQHARRQAAVSRDRTKIRPSRSAAFSGCKLVAAFHWLSTTAERTIGDRPRDRNVLHTTHNGCIDCLHSTLDATIQNPDEPHAQVVKNCLKCHETLNCFRILLLSLSLLW